jgi:hypothetical protein
MRVLWLCVVVGASGACGRSERSTVGENGGETNATGGSSAGSSSNDDCGDVTRNGRCNGNVYEWCDYYTGSIARLDCSPLGATCRALERQIDERESNGCVTLPCETGESSCEGDLFRQCEGDGILINSCAKFGGPGSLCDSDGTSFWCSRQTCSTPSDAMCAGDLRLICNEDGLLVIQDCARCDPSGTCVSSAPGAELPVDCDRASWGCEQSP